MMAKFSLDIGDLLASDHRGYSVYGIVTSPGKIVVKRESFEEGKVPEHLRSYLGQNAKVAKACKGKKGMAWVQCLREKSRELGTAKE